MASRAKPPRHDPELNAALTAFRSGDLARATALYRSVLQRRPRVADAHYALALILSRQGEPERGIEHARKAVQFEPSRALHHYALGALLRDRGDLTDALECYTKASWLDASLADCHTDAASILEQLSRFEEAEAAIARALKADPAHERAQVIRARIALRTGDPAPDRLEGFAAELRPIAEGDGATLARVLAWATLGDVHDKRGDAPEAFEAFERANAVDRTLQDAPPDEARTRYLQYIDALAGAFSRETAERWRDERPDDGLPAPALLVGFPRSGTTLTERALGAHPAVRSLEERPTFEATRDEMARMLGPEGRARPFHEALELLGADHLAHLRRFYWATVSEELGVKQAPTETIALDKLPIRIVDLPFVNRLFPEARVVVALRDPRDACLSCFRQRFSLNVPMSFFLDLEDTARLYEHAMGSWLRTREAYTFDHMEIRYEDTVSDFEGRMRALVRFLGLEWNDAVLTFHERAPERVSRTPSYHTVRQKVNTRAVARWRRYEAQLAPILPTLAPFVEAFGYDA